MMKRAVFLDRDGTLIRDLGYLNNPAKLLLYRTTIPALRLLQQAKFALVVITNQSGLARGLVSRKNLEQIHQRLKGILKKGGVSLSGIYFCPHHPQEHCQCRKPASRLYRQAAKELGIDLARSFYVGDKQSDIRAGKRLQGKTVLVLTGRGRKSLHDLAAGEADYVAPNLLSAAYWILR